MKDLATLCDVPVVPVISVHEHVALGRPIWPDFATAAGLRHCRGGLPVDCEPGLPAAAALPVDEAVWGGYPDSHFGHFAAQRLPRLPFARLKWPRRSYLFTLGPGLQESDVAAWTWAALDWVGLPRWQVWLVTTPVKVARRHAGFQAKMLPKGRPSPCYLDALDGLAALQVLAPQPADMVYVSCAALPMAGGGALAGEAYLVSVLKQLGISVLDPSTATLDQQLAVYAGASHLIFSEGSAMHGRQLRGRLPQEIAVLRRRRGRSMAREQLAPRVTTLRYCDATSGALIPQWKNGQPRPDPALALYNLPDLFAAFAKLGVDLSLVWDDEAFRAAAMQDIAAWMTVRRPSPPLLAQFQSLLAEQGLATPSSSSSILISSP